MTYNLWLINRSTPLNYHYCSTVVANDMQEAVSKTITGCDFKEENLVNWRWFRGNPRLNPEHQEVERAYILKQLG